MTSLYNRRFAVSQTTVRRRASRFGGTGFHKELASPKPKAKAGGKSELRRAVRRVTPGQGNLKESGTENVPPAKVGKGEKVR